MDAVLDACQPRRLAPHALAHRTGLAWGDMSFAQTTALGVVLNKPSPTVVSLAASIRVLPNDCQFATVAPWRQTWRRRPIGSRCRGDPQCSTRPGDVGIGLAGWANAEL